jgi:uncharacterized protein with LGFP repeats
VLGLKDTLFRISFFYPVWYRMQAKYDDLNGAPGRALGEAYRVPKGANRGLGRAQDFQHGRMTWRRRTGKTVWQWGKVLRAYDRLGRENSRLRMPTSDVWGPGWYRGATYANGAIVWSRAHGAFPIIGKWKEVYAAKGWVRGHLGVPLSSHQTAPNLPDGGLRQKFARGRMYGPPKDPAVYALWGPIADRYVEINEARSACGYPTSHVRTRDGGMKANFSHGTITYQDGAGVTVACG